MRAPTGPPLDVTIHRCRLRLVRHGGWSWGADPRALVRRTIDALPAMLAERLALLVAAHQTGDAPATDAEITSPLRVRLTLSLAELNAIAATASATSHSEFPPVGSPLDVRLDDVLRRALSESGAALQPTTGVPRDPQPEPEPASVARHLESDDDSDPLGRTLASWGGAGTLLSHLCLLTPRALDELRRLVRGAAQRDAGSRGPVVDDRVAHRLAHEIGATLRRASTDGDDALAWLVLVVQLAARLGVSPSARAVVEAVDGVVQQSTEAAVAPHEAPIATVGRHRLPPLSAVATRPAAPPRRSAEPSKRRHAHDVEIPSALPFLALGPLSRIDWLRVVGAVFGAADLEELLPAFGGALAYRMLPPPERGWRRAAGVARAAAAFVARDEAPPDADLHEMHRRLAPYAELLDVALARPLIDGHTRGVPLAIAGADGGLLVVDADGVFPVAWGAGVGELLPVLRSFGGDPVVVPRAVASPDVLRALDDAGIVFATDAAPTRHESWRALRRSAGNAERWWTNDADGDDALLARRARSGAGAAEQGERFWRAIAVERPSVAHADGGASAVERSLALAAGVALATIAWTLWRTGGPTTPMLTIDWLASLDGRVRCDDRLVRVTVPVGRRQWDLREHGLLAPVHDVPWLGGRVVELAGG